MKKTKIEWCDMAWNPITGCLHDCPYCYARGIARRFGTKGIKTSDVFKGDVSLEKGICELYEPFARDGKPQRYPFGFAPTFHRYRLGEPQEVKKPQTVFVCSMADMFGAWVPDEWIKAVFDACGAAPWHRYLFLTKNPARYVKLASGDGLPQKHWYGSTVTGPNEPCFSAKEFNAFVSFEPILEPFDAFSDSDIDLMRGRINWAILGAETGNRKGKAVPKREWIENIVRISDGSGVPVFMKDSLIPIMGEENMRRDFPEGLR
jgi:protein gp37